MAVCVLCLLQAGKLLNGEVQTRLRLGIQEGTLKLKLKKVSPLDNVFKKCLRYLSWY